MPRQLNIRSDRAFEIASRLAARRGQPVARVVEEALEAAEALYVEAATAALEQAEVAADEIDALVTVSTTGIATPSLEARVAGRMGWRGDAERVPVFGLGCAGGVTGLAIASRLAAAGKTVLFVTVELCSTSIRLDKLTKANIVATALFGDGAAACVLRGGEGGLGQVAGGAERLWPDTLESVRPPSPHQPKPP